MVSWLPNPIFPLTQRRIHSNLHVTSMCAYRSSILSTTPRGHACSWVPNPVHGPTWSYMLVGPLSCLQPHVAMVLVSFLACPQTHVAMVLVDFLSCPQTHMAIVFMGSLSCPHPPKPSKKTDCDQPTSKLRDLIAATEATPWDPGVREHDNKWRPINLTHIPLWILSSYDQACFAHFCLFLACNRDPWDVRRYKSVFRLNSPGPGGDGETQFLSLSQSSTFRGNGK